MKYTRRIWPCYSSAIASIVICIIGIVMATRVEAEQLLDQSNSEPRQLNVTPTSTASEINVKKNKSSAVNGWRAGSFIIRPEVILTEAYDDNIFATRTNEIDDSITILSPTVRIKSDWQKHKLNFGASADNAYYSSNNSENYLDYSITADGQYDISPLSNIFGGIEYDRSHEERSSADDINGIEPTVYSETSGHFGIYKKVKDYSLRLGGTIDKLDFDNVTNQLGFINDDRDRTEYSAGARISYKLGPRYEPYIQAIHVKRSYELALDDNLFNRNSDGYRAAVGVNTRLNRNTTAEFYLGYLNQDYDDKSLSDISSVDFGANVTWKLNPSTTVTGALDRSLEETTVNGASSYLYTVASVHTSHKLSNNINLDFDFSYSANEYQGINRTDKELIAGIGMKYVINPNTFLTASYRMLNRDSDIPNADYYRNQVYLGIGGLLYPVQRSRQSQATGSHGLRKAQSNILSGFYAGAQFGYGTINTASNGPRGGGGFDYGEFGNDGNTAGLFAGYGIHLNRWYLGMELEAEDSQADWYHTKDKPDSRTFNVEKNNGRGASARIGYLLNSGALLYGRFGFVDTDFHTFYTLNNEPLNAVDQEFSQTGKRYGIGVETPELEHLFWRFEYTYTGYDDYSVDYVTNAENFENSESLFRVGLGWRFDGQKPVVKKQAAQDYSGLILGGNVGHGALNTTITGLHRSGGLGPFDFAADFSNHGFTSGLFAGYGFVMDRIYLALEIDIEASHARWRHDRETGGAGGRDFSVDKKGGYGANIRLGYILPSRSLIYMQAGRMHTKFNTHYIKGGNPDAWVDRDDKQWGDRYGMGVEIPLHKKAFLRLDYSHTNYDAYEFTTTHGGNPDHNIFDNSENLFRLGMGIRF